MIGQIHMERFSNKNRSIRGKIHHVSSHFISSKLLESSKILILPLIQGKLVFQNMLIASTRSLIVYQLIKVGKESDNKAPFAKSKKYKSYE